MKAPGIFSLAGVKDFYFAAFEKGAKSSRGLRATGPLV